MNGAGNRRGAPLYAFHAADGGVHAPFTRRATHSSASLHAESPTVPDLVYSLAVVVFFALTLAYVRGCERLGRGR